jgi:UDP-N-acetylglucosamine 2-epimerase (non-hydrolysing)
MNGSRCSAGNALRNALNRWLSTPSRPVVVVIGTRAQLIKMAPLLRELENRSHPFSLIFTGQHQVTMTDILADFQISTKPIHLFRDNEVSGLGRMAIWFPRAILSMVRRRRKLFKTTEDDPRLVLVHGDTVSTLAGSIAARLAGSAIGHVEAGLRSFRVLDPFPEEVTRILVSKMTDVHFCPGSWAEENIPRGRHLSVNTGQNTLLDALRRASAVESRIPGESPVAPYCVISIHRFENIYSKKRMVWLFNALSRISQRLNVELVLHPATEKRLEAYGLKQKLLKNESIRLRPRMSYIPFIQLLRSSDFVITDGGSNQEELHYMRKPALLLRSATERPEGLNDLAVLCDFDDDELDRFLERARKSTTASPGEMPPDGPSALIAEFLSNYGRSG